MKEISIQSVINHLKRLNPWWREPKAPDPQTVGLEPRAYLPAIRDLLFNSRLRRAVVLLGPRRVGKTILIRHLIGDLLQRGINPTYIGYVEMDHPLLRDQSLESLIRLMGEASGDSSEGLRYLFFDEIQYLKDWELHLKALVDYRPDLRILVSGSAAAALMRKSTESGAGRFTDFLLPPLTFSEYLAFSKEDPDIRELADNHYTVTNLSRLNSKFVNYVNFGGYPELALTPEIRANPERFVKSDIVDKVLLRDLPQLYGIQDIQELNALFTLLAYNTGETISLEKLAKRSGVGKSTINRYIEYFEAAFLLKRIFRIDQSGRRYQRERSFKVYLTNPATRTGLFGPLGADEEGFGHLVETAIYAQRFHENANLSYARWGNNEDNEIDMIELSPALKPMMALEIKWSDGLVNRPENFSALIKFCRVNGMKEGWISTRSRFQQVEIEDVKLGFLPTAVLAFHYGVRAIKGRLDAFQIQMESNESNLS